MNHLRIFIRSTMEDLKKERKAIDRAISEIPFLRFEALRAETIGSQSTSSQEVCMMMAQQCDVYLLILGGRYGWIIPDEDISVTEMEFNEAQRLGKPTLVYKKKLDEEEIEDRQQKAFIERVGDFKEGLFWREFSADDVPDHLAAWAKEDIAGLVSQMVRERPAVTVVAEPEHVLLASLGKSPGTVTGLYHALKEQRGITVDRVLTVSPRNGKVRRCARTLMDEFRKQGVDYDNTFMDAEDIRDDGDAFEFKSKFTKLLLQEQKAGNEIYLGIAGGRTSMGALMAIVAQMAAQEAALYHLWVPEDVEEDGKFERFFALSPQRQQEVLYPKEYELVKVPFVRLSEVRRV